MNPPEFGANCKQASGGLRGGTQTRCVPVLQDSHPDSDSASPRACRAYMTPTKSNRTRDDLLACPAALSDQSPRPADGDYPLVAREKRVIPRFSYFIRILLGRKLARTNIGHKARFP